jgi:UDP-N-acetyl-2-amino-2-deoxyglucuronate dehydrogenase
MSRLRVALIGLGMAVGPHAKSLLDLKDKAEVAWAVSPSAARREAFAQSFPFPTTGDLDEVLADGSVDAVLVLTPPGTHLDVVKRAAARGKHVLVEKPLEITTARAREMVAACAAAKVRLGTVLQHRFRPAAVMVKRAVAAGNLGRLAHCSVAVPWWRPQIGYYDQPGRGTLARDGGGVLITQAIHTLDLFMHLAGPVAEVSALAGTSHVHRMETEDQVAATLRLANGAMGTLDCTTVAYPGYPETILLAGDKGSALIQGTEAAVEYLGPPPKRETAGGAAGGGGGADPMAFPHDWHRDLIADFLAAVAEGREPAIPGGEALRVHCLIDALLKSAREKRAVEPEV